MFGFLQLVQQRQATLNQQAFVYTLASLFKYLKTLVLCNNFEVVCNVFTASSIRYDEINIIVPPRVPNENTFSTFVVLVL